MTSELLIHSHTPDLQGRIIHVTPQSARWSYVGFDVYRLATQKNLHGHSGSNELCFVILSGKASCTVDGKNFGVIGERSSVFEGLPWSLYVPAHTAWSLTASTDLEVAMCAAPSKGGLAPHVIAPHDISQETRGQGTNTRYVRNILPDTSPLAESLLVVEVITPGGNWSSYPPHKHDTDNYPQETYLEETYYHRLNPPKGFGFQRVYTDDGSLDESFAIKDGDVVLVPKGYHPVAAPHGFDLYYLNVMAGPKKAWKFTMSEDHAHIGWTTTPKR